MCSVSWWVTKDGYQLFFNRDEQKSRALALPPQTCNIDQVRVLMPIDPTGQGSWISMNEHGLSLCLLNNYQAQQPTATHSFLRHGQISDLISRGQLLKQLSGSINIKAVAKRFQQMPLEQFAPFTLLAFDTQLKPMSSERMPALTHEPLIPSGRVIAFAWNGQHAHVSPVDSPLFSSGIDLQRVQAHRLQAYRHQVGTQPTTQHFLNFHRTHAPEHAHRSVCMHREDAHTVSFTHIKVAHGNQASRAEQTMIYIPGSPCCQLTETNLQTHCYRLTPHSARTTTAVM